MRVPDADIVFDDLVRGQVRFAAAHVPDYVIVRANGDPLYTLVNPVDDSLMRITHVLRGEDLLPSTPRQIVLYEALRQIGVGSGRVPAFGHLPTVLGEGSRRLSKRDKGSGLAEYQRLGYLPEALLNYLALLGWAIAEDRDIFSPSEMVEAFDIRRVNANPARFDARKCEAINAAHIRMLPTAELTDRIVPFLVRSGLVSDPPLPDERERLDAATPLIQERINTLSETVELLGFLFQADEKITVAADAGLSAASAPALAAATEALRGVETFDAASIEAALRAALVDGLGLKPRLAFGPVRAAVTGQQDLPAAVRVARTARPGLLARSAGCGRGRLRRQGGLERGPLADEQAEADRSFDALPERTGGGSRALRRTGDAAAPGDAWPVTGAAVHAGTVHGVRRLPCRRTVRSIHRSCAVRRSSGGGRCSERSAALGSSCC